MPYTKENIPDRIKGLPEHAQEIWIEAFNNALKQYDGDEEKANATAWSAVKKAGYKKNEKGEWVKMSESEPNFDEVEIFETGDYPQGKFTSKDLDEIVGNYDPEHHEAPTTIDHAFDGPAHGWVEKVWRQGDKLYAKIKDVSNWLKDQIKSGAYKKRSIEVWEDYEGTGKKMLKAISFLGAMIPQVKGLKNIYAEYGGTHGAIAFFSDLIEFEFTEEDKEIQQARSAKFGISIIENGHVIRPKGWLSVPDDQWGDPVNFAYPCSDIKQTETALKFWDMSRNRERYSSKDQAKITERLRKFAKKFEIESEIFKHSEVEMTPEEVKKMVDVTLKEQSEKLTAQFSKDIKSVKDENAKLKTRVEEKEKKFSDAQKAVKVDALIDGLLKDRKILPALKDAGLKDFMLGLPDDNIIKFGENEKSMTDWIVEVFGQKLPGIDFGEIVKPEDSKKVQTASFKVVRDDKRSFVDADSFDLNKKVLAYAKENKVPYKEALVAVSSE